MSALDDALARIDLWGATNAAATVLDEDGIRGTHGDAARSFRWASVTKLATTLTVLIAAEAGRLELDDPAGPPGSTVRHLLAHASGLPFNGAVPIADPGMRRIYSNPGFDILGRLVGERDGRGFDAVLHSSLLDPLGMAGTRLVDRPSQGLHGPLRDLATLAAELLRPTLIRPETLAIATSVAFPGLVGLLPGVGRFDPLDWGLGFEPRDAKTPHWMGTANSPGTFGHFGGAGTFVWVDPAADVAAVVLTDRDFGPWALDAWPSFSDTVLAATAGRQAGGASP